MKFSKYLLSFLFISFCYISFAQQNNTDSLLNLIKIAKEDTAKINILNTLSEQHWRQGDYETAMKYANEALTLSNSLPIGKGQIEIAASYDNIGIIYKHQNNYEKALENYLSSLKIRKEIGDKNSIAKSYNNIGSTYDVQSNYEKALENYYTSLKIFKEVQDRKNVARSYIQIGYVYSNQGYYEKALKNYLASLKIYEELTDEENIGFSYINIGIVYYNMGNYSKALENYFTALKIFEKAKNKWGIAKTYNNIAIIYNIQNNIDEALKNYHSSLEIYEEIGNKKSISTSLNNIGIVYYNLKNYEKALVYFNKSLKTREEIEDKHGIAVSHNNIGIIYRDQQNYEKALENYFASLKIEEEIGDKRGLALSYNNIGNIYILLRKFTEARKYLNKGLSLAKEINSKDNIKESYRSLSQLDSVLGNWEMAYEYHKLYTEFKDSIFNEENSEKMAEMLTRYESEKKDAEIKLLNVEKEKQAAISKAENKKQRIIIYAISGGFIMMLLLASVIFKALYDNRKKNKIITNQKQTVEEKNKEISDSIRYAKRIQEAILPSMAAMQTALRDSFVLYKPKDVVAGDFYWMEIYNNKVYFAAADCTGHGVPGAMMSVVCSNALSKALLEENAISTGDLLDKTRDIVINRLTKNGETVQDGMDISLCAIDFENLTLQWSGANNPLWIIRNEKIIEYKHDKQPIGVYDNLKPFTTNNINLQRNDTLYIFTDGYQDQFGGEKGKKFRAIQLKEKLLNIQKEKMDVQKTILDKEFEKWKGQLEQLDDVCIIGMRIN